VERKPFGISGNFKENIYESRSNHSGNFLVLDGSVRIKMENKDIFFKEILSLKPPTSI